MAKKVQVLLVDDIDKSSPADETVSFSLDGVSYEIDLTSDNAAKLRDDLAVWIGHAERTGGRRSSGRTASKGSRPQGRPRCGPRLGARQRPPGQRPRPYLRRGPGRLRQGPRLSPEHLTDAAPPDPAGAASLMSRRHAWLGFTAGGPALPQHRSPADRRRRGSGGLTVLQGRWYDVVAPPQVAAVFVLQWLLQVPAAHRRPRRGRRAVARRPRRAHLRRSGRAWSRRVVRLTALEPDAGPLAERLDRAERDYRAVAEPRGRGLPGGVRARAARPAALVDDMWVGRPAARPSRLARAVRGPGVAPRESCCLHLRLPGCVECAGCPRLRQRRRPPRPPRLGAA